MQTEHASRPVDERVSYGVAHHIRVEVLCLLNQGTYSSSDLAKETRQHLSVISYHVKELLKEGCIELVATRTKRNANQHFYRAIKLPLISDEEAALLSPLERKEIAGVILQGIMAEGLDALRVGKLSDDPSRVRMMWRWFPLDEQGCEEIASEQAESWERMTEIAASSTNRRVNSGEEPVTHIVATLGFPRSRPVGAAPANHFLKSKGNT